MRCSLVKERVDEGLYYMVAGRALAKASTGMRGRIGCRPLEGNAGTCIMQNRLKSRQWKDATPLPRVPRFFRQSIKGKAWKVGITIIISLANAYSRK